MQGGVPYIQSLRNQELLHSIPEELREKEAVHLISTPGDCQKALGVHWNTDLDTLHVSNPTLTPLRGPTKRQIASDMAKTFDLLGWFALVLKILLQSLWKLGLNWDERVPEELAMVWRNWQEEISHITCPDATIRTSRGCKHNSTDSLMHLMQHMVEWYTYALCIRTPLHP